MVGAAIAAAAVVGAVGSSMAAGTQAKGARAAADAQLEATRLSVAEQRRQFDQVRTDFAPYREIGEAALGEYAALYGIGREGQIPRFAADVEDIPETLTREVTEQVGGGGRVGWQGVLSDLTAEDLASMDRSQLIPIGYDESEENQGVQRYAYLGAGGSGATRTFTEEYDNPAFGGGPNVSRSMEEARNRFMTTPGYEFRVEEGVRALDRSAAARGSLGGGGYGRDLERFGQGIAAAEFENYANRLAGLATTGQSAAAGTAAAGMQSATNIGNALMSGAANQGNFLAQAGTARASGYAGIGNAIGGGLNNYAYYQGFQQNGLNQNPSYSTTQFEPYGE